MTVKAIAIPKVNTIGKSSNEEEYIIVAKQQETLYTLEEFEIKFNRMLSK